MKKETQKKKEDVEKEILRLEEVERKRLEQEEEDRRRKEEEAKRLSEERKKPGPFNNGEVIPLLLVNNANDLERGQPQAAKDVDKIEKSKGGCPCTIF